MTALAAKLNVGGPGKKKKKKNCDEGGVTSHDEP
jgi:hypothetical protein